MILDIIGFYSHIKLDLIYAKCNWKKKYIRYIIDANMS